MNECPACKVELDQFKTNRGMVFACNQCGGRAIGVAVLRKDAAKQFLNRLWLAARDDKTLAGRGCPFCQRPMKTVTMPMPAPDTGDGKQSPDPAQNPAAVEFDVCTLCQCVWFDAGELDGVPAEPAPEKEKLDPRAAEAAAMFKIDSEQTVDDVKANAMNAINLGDWLGELIGIIGRFR